jgi:Uma2 family endonuclease
MTITATTTSADETPRSNVVTLKNVDWADYCKLRDEPTSKRIRMSYLDGVLTLLSPEYVHDDGAERLGLLIRGVTSGLGLTIMGIRTTTLRKGIGRYQGSGKEPDNAFYLGENERRMRKRPEKDKLDLAIDPPPDIAIEVDNTNDSEAALPIYARLGVPEVWRYDVDDRTLWIGRLDGESYIEVDRSVALPRLTPSLVLHALDVFDQGEMDENAWFDWIKAWARDLPEAPANA